MKISIALATYNGAVYLREQLTSIRNQSLLPSELVISDDGSTDATLEIVKTFAATAPYPVRILDKSTRLGFSDNFLHAAESCTHDIIAFCDQDDVWLPNKLETGLKRLERDNSLLSMHRLNVTNEHMVPTGEIWTQNIEGDNVFEPLQLDPYINGWGNSMMVRRELIHLIPRANRPRQPERNHLPLSHDTWLYVLAAALGRVSHIMEPLLLYRQHSSNAEGVKAPGRRQQLKKMALGQTLRMREQSRFNDAMVAIFSEVAQRPEDPFAAPARKAAAEFAKRRDLILDILKIYSAPSFQDRLKAFHALGMSESPPRAVARLKQLLIGVAGVNRAIDKS